MEIKMMVMKMSCANLCSAHEHVQAAKHFFILSWDPLCFSHSHCE